MTERNGAEMKCGERRFKNYLLWKNFEMEKFWERTFWGVCFSIHFGGGLLIFGGVFRDFLVFLTCKTT